MSIPLTINGVTFNYPQQFDTNWGPTLTNWSSAVTNGMLQTSGINPANLLSSSTTNPSSSGFLRLAKTDTISWRNNANLSDLPLAINGSDQLTFNGTPLATSSGGTVNLGTQYQLGYYATTSTVISGLTLITPNKVLESDANGLPIASSVSSTTLAFLDATSSIQTQLNSNAAAAAAAQTTANNALPTTGGTMSGNIAMGANKVTGLAAASTANDAIAYGQSSWSLAAGTITGALSMNTNKITNLVDGTSPSDAATFGQIHYIQAFQNFNTSTTTTTSSTPQSTGLSASITPSSTSYRVKVTVTGTMSISTAGPNVAVTLLRNSSNIAPGGSSAFQTARTPSAAVTTFPVSFSYIDSPATTSLTTYTVAIFNNDNSTSVQWNRDANSAIIMLEQIL